jgi:hypothetical protein
MKLKTNIENILSNRMRAEIYGIKKKKLDGSWRHGLYVSFVSRANQSSRLAALPRFWSLVQRWKLGQGKRTIHLSQIFHLILISCSIKFCRVRVRAVPGYAIAAISHDDIS